ncbi:MAG TPA: hypothetical protein VMT00_14605 [Thermoanaerobaculia bacterium]|nr:hypothetical protein [Thermoanaerobaculia bacterium]
MGRRNAGVKFYRLVLITSAALILTATIAHLLAGRRGLAFADAIFLVAVVIVYLVLRYPKRLIFRLSVALLGGTCLAVPILAFHAAVMPSHLLLSIAGAISSSALLGSVTLAMLLGHWYLVVRGMAIDPLARLTVVALGAMILKLLVVGSSIGLLVPEGLERGTDLHRLLFREGIFFWMRVGWGLLAPPALYPMIRGTVKLHSTMAATGILYVAVVAVVIGEVLGGYLSMLIRLPL